MKIQDFSGSCVVAPEAEWSSSSGPVTLPPRGVIKPNHAADVSAAVRWAAAENHSLTPRAAGTGMPGGNVGRDLLLDLGPTSPFAWIGPVDVERRCVSVGPGAIADQVNHAAQAAGLVFSGLPSSSDRCTIGGMIANNSAGARSFQSGAIARRVRGLTVVDAHGGVHRLERGIGKDDPFTQAAAAAATIATWPQVRKNSSGYGLDRFLLSGDGIDLVVGSEGTLGIVVEAVLDLDLPPLERRTLVVGAASDEELLAWTQLAWELELSACEFIGPWLLEKAGLAKDPSFRLAARDARHLLILEASGSSDTVTAALAAIQARAEVSNRSLVAAKDPEEQKALWGIRRRASPAIAEAAAHGHRSMQFIEDSVVPPHALGDYLVGVEGLLADAGFEAAIFGHAGDANVHINPLVPLQDPDWRPRVRKLLYATADLVAALGGTLAGEHGDGRIRAPLLKRIWGREGYDVFAELKRQLDPKGILNPGVIVPIAGQDPLDGLEG